METTRYIIYEKMYNNIQINVKIRGIYNDKNVAENKFNELKKYYQIFVLIQTIIFIIHLIINKKIDLKIFT